MEDSVSHKKYVTFDKKLWMIGFGIIGSGLLPLILRHIDIKIEQIIILSKHPDMTDCSQRYGVEIRIVEITRENYQSILDISEGDMIVNVSFDVGSVDIIKHCSDRNALYVDTSTEPWAGVFMDSNLSPSLRSNYAFREESKTVKDYQNSIGKYPTVIISHGANPGLVSSFAKQAVITVARDHGYTGPTPKTSQDWAKLAYDTGIKVIQISERDNQCSNVRKKANEFVNTWSIMGMVSEACQPSELGWGTHEKHFPEDGHHHEFGPNNAIYIDKPGLSCKARSWAPRQGCFHGKMITHVECLSISEYFTYKDSNNNAIYRPSVMFAYHPCDDALLSILELTYKEYDHSQFSYRFLMNDIVEGMDELGVIVGGFNSGEGCYWFGSALNIEQVRKLVPYHNCTSLQVTISCLAAIIYAIENPNLGFLESEQLDFERILEIASPYLGDYGGTYSDWNPIKNRSKLFEEDIDFEDPWQFKNIRVV